MKLGGTYQEKTFTANQNGNYTLNPDTGYDAMSSVHINVSVSGSGETILDVGDDEVSISGTTLVFEEKEYTELQYIQRNTAVNDPVFGVGVLFTSNIYFELDFSLLSASASEDQRLTYPSDLIASSYYFIAGPYNGKFRFIIASNSSQDISTSLDTYRHTYTFTKSGSYYQMILDGVVKKQTTTAFSTTSELGLGNAPCRIYSFKVYSGSTLIRNLIPVKDSNNEACLYDLVNSRFYKPQTSGSYIAGPEL